MYNLKLKDIFVAPGRQVKNIGGRIVVFFDGLATNVSESVAELARKQYYIEEVINVNEDTQEATEETPEVDDGFVEHEGEEVPEDEIDEETEYEGSVENTTSEVIEESIEVEVPVVHEEENNEEEEVEEVSEGYVEVSSDVVSDVEETEDNKLTAEEIQGLYDELGTWSSVAEYLDVSTATLRRYREEVGLL